MPICVECKQPFAPNHLNRKKFCSRQCNKRYEGKKQYQQQRRRVIAAYGGECACCGETIYEFLSIDHINNDGAVHRARTGYGSGVNLIREIIRAGFPDTYQVLCHNCNQAKAYGICPHQRGM